MIRIRTFAAAVVVVDRLVRFLDRCGVVLGQTSGGDVHVSRSYVREFITG